MATNCPVEQELCPMFRGDSALFTFTFVDSEENPIDISGNTLFFTMKENASSADNSPGDLQHSEVFPSNSDSVSGRGTMTVPSSKTQSLNTDTTYFYDFQLVNGDIVTTLGSGTVEVKRDITWSVS